METKGIDLTKCKNLKFKAKINGTPCGGAIQVENGSVYLCQNDKKGANSDDKLGFMYSWYISKGSPEDMKRFDINVTDFEIVPRDPERYQDWQVGDRCYQPDEDDYIGIMEVIFRSGELVVLKDVGDEVLCLTVAKMKQGGIVLELTNIEKQIIEERKEAEWKEAEWKPQDGDICFVMDRKGNNDVFIFKDGWYRTTYYASCSYPDEEGTVMLDDAIDVLRPATEEEKQRLFASMTKEGKRWNAEKKCVENIPKSHEFRKGEPVLARSGAPSKWCICAYVQAEGTMTKVFVGEIETFFEEVIPYNERTMHLLGTNEDYREE